MIIILLINVTKIQVNSFIKAPKTVFLLFIVIFVFLNNFQFKSQNKVSSILGQPLTSLVYDSVFNSILPFLVNFGILSPNCIISVNQGFKHFSQYLYALQPSKANQTIINKHRRFVKFFSSGFQFYPPCGFRETPHEFKVYYQKLIVQFLFYQENIVCAFFRLSRHQLSLHVLEILKLSVQVYHLIRRAKEQKGSSLLREQNRHAYVINNHCFKL